MKKIVLLSLLFTMAVVGLYYANAYTSAIVENPVSLSVTNPHGMLSLIPEKNLEIMQGGDAKALTLTNNMGVYINYELNCSHAGISLNEDDKDGTLAPGDSDDIWLEVAGDCAPGPISLEIILSAEFDGGRAEVKQTLQLTVLEAPRLEQATLEDESKNEEVEKGDALEEEVDSGDEPPADPGVNPQTGGEEQSADEKDNEENNTPPGTGDNSGINTGDGLLENQEGS